MGSTVGHVPVHGDTQENGTDTECLGRRERSWTSRMETEGENARREIAEERGAPKLLYKFPSNPELIPKLYTHRETPRSPGESSSWEAGSWAAASKVVCGVQVLPS